MAIPKKCALYLRVSTEAQTVANQEAEARALAVARGFEVVQVFSDTESATKHRPGYEAMMLAARRGKIDGIVIWAIDRLHRSMTGAIGAVLELDRLGVQIVSLREPWLDSQGPARPLLVALFGWVAEQERTRLVERTKAGLERARREGKRIGRPRVRVDVEKALRLRQQGLGLREVARRLGVGASTMARVLAASKALSGRDPGDETGGPEPHPTALERGVEIPPRQVPEITMAA